MPNQFHQRREIPDIQYRLASIQANDALDGFEGHAATFWTVDTYGTAFAKGAFRRSLNARGDRLPVLWQHNPDIPIGRHQTIKEDSSGLYVDTHIADDGAEGTVALKRLRAGVPLGLSFGFQTVKDRSVEDGDPDIDLSSMPGLKRPDVRVITEVRLWETSLVTFPANELAAITAVRSEVELDALSTLLDELRTGAMDAPRLALVDQIVLARQATAPADPQPRTAAQARRRNVEAAIASARWAPLLEQRYDQAGRAP